jgi:hypothetical protein
LKNIMFKAFQNNQKDQMKRNPTVTRVVGAVLVLGVIFALSLLLMSRSGSEFKGWWPAALGTIEQSDWSGGAAGDKIFSVPDNSYATSSNIGTSEDGGSLILEGF